ncbi:FixH family protein [Lutimaribacter saemankumensis]|uniref:Nitrogen fixation protein FixH n=1 Tax=Lutimaribacter saemankumensis TaxID=490829 RepID=A0A1G8N2B0_9RHOB|nr:FixH family protein [Lutimaribacter saemankumensis]SDI74293.1 Nitrogen fixation protein FixH [Lutimaribacter saemankumensis]
MAERQITGRQVFFGFVAFFGVIITVNIVMAYSAISTFPGLEVRNGYVASQSFDDRRAAQEALGWTARVEVNDGRLSVAITDAQGQPVQAGNVQALVGRPTSNRDDFTPELVFNGRVYEAPVELSGGKWILHLKAQSLAGEPFEQRLDVHVNS